MNIRPIITPVVQKAKYAAMATALVAGATALNSCKKEQICVTEYYEESHTDVTTDGDTIANSVIIHQTPKKCY